MGKGFGYLLIAAVLLVEVPRFMGAFAAVDDTPLTAFGTAILLSGGSMYVFHTWWKTKRQHRNRLLAPFGVNLALVGFILVPYGMGRLRGVPVLEVVGEWVAWAWVSVVYLSPFLMAGGVTTALAFQKDAKQGKKQERTIETSEPEIKPDEPAVQLDQLNEQIVQVYSAHPNATYQLVSDITGIPKSTVYGRAKTLERQGIIGGNHHGT